MARLFSILMEEEIIAPISSNAAQWNIISRAAEQEKLKQVFGLFREKGLEALLIKGWAVQRFFPPEVPRYSVDIDLVFFNSDFHRAKEASAASQINIDLHNELAHLDKTPYRILFERSKIIILDNGAEVRVLSDEDNLRVAAFHWISDGAVKKDRLWDIYYLVKNRAEGFDWDKCFAGLDENKKKWLMAAIALANKYLDLDISSLPFREEISVDGFIPRWIIKTIEKEWHDPVNLKPLHAILSSPKDTVQQIRKRFPPNAITASFMSNAPVNNFPRLPFQLLNMAQRFFPSEKNYASPFSLIKNKLLGKKSR